MKRLLLLFFGFCFYTNIFAQSFAINTDGSNAGSSAILDVKSTTKGVLIPRMSKAERNAIATPATGLLVYQNAPDSMGFYYYNGSIWKWFSNPNSETGWNINGNTGTDPNTNYIGTNDNRDLGFRINGFERMRLTGEAALGIGNFMPKYPLDINYGQAGISNCDKSGIRIKSIGVISNDCDKGLLLGYTDPTNLSNDAVLWNYGQSNSGLKNIIFGIDNFERMRLDGNGFLGLNNILPNYTLDINTGFNAVNPCGRNGLRLDFPNPFWNCDRGLFFGFDNGSGTRSTSIWNFEDENDPGADLFLRIGFGNQFYSSGQGGEVMRILPPGKGIGIGTTTPLAMLHITNYSAGPALPGVMYTPPILAPGSPGFYTGLQFTGTGDEGFVWNYRNAPVIFGTDDVERMVILGNGNVGIGEPAPLEKLHINGSIRSNALTAFDTRMVIADVTGTLNSIPNGSDGSVLTVVTGAPTWSTNANWSPFGNSLTDPATNFIGTTDATDLVLRTDNTERMRIAAGGKVGIGTANPAKQTEIIGPASATPVTLVIGNRAGFGPAAMEFVSDYGLGNQWRPGYMRSNDVGSFTGSLEFYTNGTGAANLYGNIKGLEVRNGVTYTATGTVGSFSDERIKNNVQPFTSGLDIINQINPVSFYYNEQSPFQTDKMQVGILAQQLEKIAPFMVDKNASKDFDDLRSVNNQAYIFLLINAVKELQKEVEELKSKK